MTCLTASGLRKGHTTRHLNFFGLYGLIPHSLLWVLLLGNVQQQNYTYHSIMAGYNESSKQFSKTWAVVLLFIVNIENSFKYFFHTNSNLELFGKKWSRKTLWPLPSINMERQVKLMKELGLSQPHLHHFQKGAEHREHLCLIK